MIEKRAVISPEDTPDLQAVPGCEPAEKIAEAADTIRRLDAQDLPGSLSRNSPDEPRR